MSDLRDDLRDPMSGIREPADAAIEAHYRAGSAEQPGAAADAAILALARTAAVTNTEANAAANAAPNAAAYLRPAANDAWWVRRWRAPLALAAGVVLSVGIVTRIQLDPPDDALSRAERASEAAPAVAAVPVAPTAPAVPTAPQAAPAAAAPATAMPPAPASAAPQEPAARREQLARSSEREASPALAKRAASGAGAPAAAPLGVATREAERKLAMPAQSPSQAVHAPAQIQPFGLKADAPAVAKSEAADAGTTRDAAEARAAALGSASSAPAPAAKPAPPRPAAAPVMAAPAASAPTAAGSGAFRRDAPAAEDSTTAKTLQGTTRSRSTTGPAAAVESFALLTFAQEAQLTPERWITYLIELRQRGEHDAADASLLRLRARYPEQAIPAAAASGSPR